MRARGTQHGNSARLRNRHTYPGSPATHSPFPCTRMAGSKSEITKSNRAPQHKPRASRSIFDAAGHGDRTIQRSTRRRGRRGFASLNCPREPDQSAASSATTLLTTPSYNRFIVTYPLHLVPLGIEDVQRPPMYPGVFGGRDGQTQALQPRLLRFIISQGDLEGDVVNRGRCGIEPPDNRDWKTGRRERGLEYDPRSHRRS